VTKLHDYSVGSSVYARPKTEITPYTSPAIETRETKPHMATSPFDQPLVDVFLTVYMKTLANMTTPRVKLITPVIKFAISYQPPEKILMDRGLKRFSYLNKVPDLNIYYLLLRIHLLN